MQLVDKDDGILVLHQFFHDGLEALFKLSAILGAGNDERKVEGEDALVGQERSHFTVSNTLGQAFDDSSLAYAGFADEHRIVLGAAAKDLDGALEFVVASNERIELVVDGGLSEVARKFSQQGRLAVALRRRRFLLRGPSKFFTDGTEAQSTFVEDLRRKAFFFAQQP